MAILRPKLLLHIEGLAVLALACILYQRIHSNWGWFALLFLMPDFFMLGYLVSKKIGAACYNLGHTYLTPLALLLILWISGHRGEFWIGLIWIAHIGFDRMLGFGLKYESEFKDTHLQRV